MLNRKIIFAWGVMHLFSSIALAQDEVGPNEAEVVVKPNFETDDVKQQPAIEMRNKPGFPLWEAGVLGMGLSHPAYPGADDQTRLLLGLPYVIYRGDYLRVERENVGVRAIKTPRTELDIGFAAAPGSQASDIEARRGMDDLGILLEFGPRLKINLGVETAGGRSSRIQLAARGVFDANDHLSYHGIAFEPQWVKDIFLFGQWMTSISLGAVYGDQKLVDTFYRVTAAEATPSRSAYEARAGLILLRAGVFASRLLDPDVRFFSYLRLDSVEGAANHNSPLVKRDFGWSAGLGFAWTLARSERFAKD